MKSEAVVEGLKSEHRFTAFIIGDGEGVVEDVDAVDFAADFNRVAGVVDDEWLRLREAVDVGVFLGKFAEGDFEESWHEGMFFLGEVLVFEFEESSEQAFA